MSKRLVLVDGSWLVFRAFFAIPPAFSTAAGLHTNATYGFATVFRKLAQKRPTWGAVVFDAPGRVWREDLLPAYKGDRPPMPGDLVEQLPWIDRLVRAHGFPVLREPGWEADDLIGSLARRAEAAGHEVILVAGDKDFAQLVSGRVTMYDSMRELSYDPELVRKKWGVPPSAIVDLLALVGDAVDCIPGVPGIGEKTATALLAEHQSLDGIYAALDRLPARQARLLTEGEASARLSQRLASIRLDAPVPELDGLLLPPADKAALDALYRELEFRSLLEDAPAALPAVEVVDGPGAAAFAAEALAILPVLDSPRGGAGRWVGAALAGAGRVVYLPGSPEPLRPWLEGPAPKLTHDRKALEKALAAQGIGLAACDDTQLMSFLVEPTRCIPHELDRVAKEYVGHGVPALKELVGSGQAQVEPSARGAAEAAAWAGARARTVAELGPVLRTRLAEAGLEAHHRAVELPLSSVLGRMERAGIGVDPADLDRLGLEFRARCAELEAEVHRLAGRPFNLGSTQQLATVLFEELKLPVLKKNKTGWSTDAEVLEALAKEHPIARALLDHRALAKLINTYTDVLRAAVDPEDGRVHATLQQTVGVSGRLISTDPDLQRTPVRTPEGKRIRHAFVAAPGWRLMSADWSQIELRVLAHFSGDPRLILAFAEGRDVHRATAAQIFGVAPELLSPAQRSVGKTINFATIYGQGATALGQILGIPRKEAQAYIERFFATYDGVRSWLDRTIAEATEHGYVTTILGRRRFIPELSSHAPMERQAGERIAANTPIQGSAADLCKLAMLAVDEALRPYRARMVLQVHDELLIELPEAEVEAVRAIVVEKMTHPMPLRVPLAVNVGVGPSWGDAH